MVTIEQKNASTYLANVGRVAFFMFWLLTGLGIFGFYAGKLAFQIINEDSVVSLNKGAFLCFGLALALGAFLFGDIIYAQILKRTVSTRLQRLIVRTIVIGFAMMLLLPHVVHYSVAAYLENKGYEHCEIRSHRWLIARTVVYTNNAKLCRQ